MAERMKFLMLGNRVKASIDPDNLLAIFEGMREMLLPLVRWMDRPLSQLRPFSNLTLPASLQKARAMLVYDGWGYGGFMTLALDRQGMWFVDLFQVTEGERVRKVASTDLVQLVLERLDKLVPLFSDHLLSQEWKVSRKELQFLEGLLRYAAVVAFIMKCHETIRGAIDEQEGRIRVLRERLGLFGQFTQVLDPLIAGRATARLPGQSIFSRCSESQSRSTATYFSAEALKPFWGLLKKRSFVDDGSYFLHEESREFESLKGLADFVGSLLREIQNTRSRHPGQTLTAQMLWGYSSGRLPLGADEIEELKKAVASID